MKIITLAFASALALSGSMVMAQTSGGMSGGGTAAGGSSATGGQAAPGKTGGQMTNGATGGAGMTTGASGTMAPTPRTNDASKSGAPNASPAEKGMTGNSTMSK